MTNGVILRSKATKNLKFIFLNAKLNRTQISTDTHYTGSTTYTPTL